MPIESLDLLNGILLLIFSSISLIVGIRIFLKYFEIKRREFLCVGIAWIGIASPWYPGSISFILVFILGLERLTPEVYFLIGNIMIPPSLICWMIAFTNFFYYEKQKMIVSIYIIINIIYIIYFLFFLLTNHSIIGELNGATDVQYYNFVVVYDIFVILTILITGVLFSIKTMKSSDKLIQWKGKFLLIAFITYTIGASLDTLLTLNVYPLVLCRSFEILSSITFYGGYILPKWIKNRLSRNNSNKF